LPLECFKKLRLMFLNIELNKNKLEVNKWEIEIDKLIEYKYKNDVWIIDIIKVI